ncbi:golvesin C-terminal-like domain-containing protein, partial [Marinilabilia sp.]
QPDFTNYQLEFSSHSNLKAFSQGSCFQTDSGTRFVNDQPLNGLSLIAGHYSLATTTVDSLEYQLATNIDNQLIASNFNQIGDTLPSLIRDLKNQYERRVKLEYPFKRLKIIEVPIHFYSYLQPWRSGTDHIQPEMILLPEYGAGKWFLDIYRTRNDFEEEVEQQGQETDEEDIQSRMFVTLAGNAFVFPRWHLFDSDNDRNMDEWSRIQIFPLYFYHAYQVREDGWPVFQIMLEEAIRSKGRKEFGNSWRQENDQYKGHLALKDKSLAQWLMTDNAGDTIARILNLAGVQFFAEISSIGGEADFIERMQKPMQRFAFQQSTPVQWLGEVEVPVDLVKKYKQLLHNNDLPAFKMGKIRTSEIRKDGKSRYLVSLEVGNEGWSDGVLDMQITFLDLSENRGRSFSQWMYQNVEGEENVAVETHVVSARSKAQINMVFDQLPRELKVNTGVSRNIPPFYSFALEGFEYEGHEYEEEGVLKVDTIIKSSEKENVYVVDNEDPGFSIASRDEIRTLKDWWIKHESEKVNDYVRFRHWRPQSTWVSTLGNNYFGDFLRSAFLKASGKGDDRAKWTCSVAESGSYEVQVFIPENLNTGWRNRNTRGRFRYTVYHAGEEEVVETPPVRERNGWVSLGRFYFDAGDATVELSDQSDFPYVVADAVKWIKN